MRYSLSVDFSASFNTSLLHKVWCGAGRVLGFVNCYLYVIRQLKDYQKEPAFKTGLFFETQTLKTLTYYGFFFSQWYQ